MDNFKFVFILFLCLAGVFVYYTNTNEWFNESHDHFDIYDREPDAYAGTVSIITDSVKTNGVITRMWIDYQDTIDYLYVFRVGEIPQEDEILSFEDDRNSYPPSRVYKEIPTEFGHIIEFKELSPIWQIQPKGYKPIKYDGVSYLGFKWVVNGIPYWWFSRCFGKFNPQKTELRFIGDKFQLQLRK